MSGGVKQQKGGEKKTKSSFLRNVRTARVVFLILLFFSLESANFLMVLLNFLGHVSRLNTHVPERRSLNHRL